MSARAWIAALVAVGGAFVIRPAEPVISATAAADRTPPPRSTTRPSWRSPSTTPTSRWCATCATLQIPRGIGNLRFMDIAATVNPATVHFRSLTEPTRVSVLEQNYEYDLLEPEKLLRKYVGRDVTLVRTPAGRRHDEAGRSHGAPPELQQRPRLADRQRDRDRPAARSHPLPGAARQPVLASRR